VTFEQRPHRRDDRREPRAFGIEERRMRIGAHLRDDEARPRVR
jgi:hypothetical protein